MEDPQELNIDRDDIYDDLLIHLRECPHIERDFDYHDVQTELRLWRGEIEYGEWGDTEDFYLPCPHVDCNHRVTYRVHYIFRRVTE